MNFNGPVCPKCQKALSLRFAFRLVNPYKFECPYCGAKLRWKKATLLLSGSTAIGLSIAGLAGHFYVITQTWSTAELVIFIFVALPVASLAWCLCFWKSDTLIGKRASDASVGEID